MTDLFHASVRRLPGLLCIFILFMAASLQAQVNGVAVDIIGEASVVIFDDFEASQSETRYYVIDDFGNEQRLFFSGPAPVDFLTGHRVLVHGHSQNGAVVVDSFEILERAPVAPLATPETRKVLTLLVDFNDAVVTTGTSNGTSVAQVRDRMYNETKSVAGLFFNSSLRTLTLDPDGDGDGQQDVFHVSIDDSYIGGDPSQCDPSGWVTKASDAWEDANPGKNINDYRHRLLIIPNYADYRNRHCTWGGVALVGCGSWCWAIAADPNSIMHGVIVHELGHNLGFNHARTDGNNNGFDSSETGTDSEYGDNSDLMGSSREWKKFNPPHAEDLGWIDPSDYEIRTVVPATSPQLFDLLPLDDEAWDWPGLRALKLERSGGSDYYVAFRRASGDYNNLDAAYRDRVVIYYGTDNSTYSYQVTSLAAGQSFVDSTKDVVISATSAVTIENGGQSTQAMGVSVCRQACTATPAPSNLTAVAVSTSAIDLDWIDNSSGEDGFDIERAVNGGAWSFLITVPSEAIDYSDTSLQSGTDYAYRVRASSPTGDSGWSNTASAKTIGIPPVADFSFVTNYLAADFTDLSSDSDGTIVSWNWSFGDGASSSAANPSHVYSAADTYTVSLTVTDEDGYNDNTSQDVAVFDPPGGPPTADFSFSVDGLQVTFTDLSSDSDGTVTGWSWDFGDGNSATVRNPVHTYAAGGDYDVTLTATDDGGLSDAVIKQVSVTESPAFSDHSAVSETAVFGAVSGSLSATVDDDGATQSISERLSSGPWPSRYSTLEHRWNFNIPAGDSVTVFVNAWQTFSNDGDTFDFEWSADGNTWMPMLNVSATTDGTPQSFELPPGTSGAVLLRVVDTNRVAGRRFLDTVYVDMLRIRVGGEPPEPEPFDNDPPSNLAATATSGSVIELSWTDNGSNEEGFAVERRVGTGAWTEIATTAANSGASAAYTDTGLSSSTTYDYRVRSFKDTEYSAYSNTASATTPGVSQINLSLLGATFRGIQRVRLTWSGATTSNVDIYRDGSLLITTLNDGQHGDAPGSAPSYTYQVCESGSTTVCSAVETVTF